MRLLFSAASLLLFAFSMNAQISCADSVWVSKFVPDTIVLYKSIDSTKLYLHIFLPDKNNESGKFPCMVFFFGGGWSRGTPCQFYPAAHYFASRGMVACCVEYRVRSRNNTRPEECMKDAKSAVRWIKMNAEKFRIDTSRIVASGGSAGGQLAVSLSAIPELNEDSDDRRISAVPSALVLFNPALALRNRAQEEKIFGSSREALLPAYQINPVIPPAVIFHGDADTTVPVVYIRDFCNKVNRNGKTVELNIYPGQPHGFFNYKNGKNPYYFKTLEKADEFLTKNKFIETK